MSVCFIMNDKLADMPTCLHPAYTQRKFKPFVCTHETYIVELHVYGGLVYYFKVYRVGDKLFQGRIFYSGIN